MVQGETPPGSQYGITGSDWLQSLARGINIAGAGMSGLYRGPGRGTAAAWETLQGFQKQQDRANQQAGYAAHKPAQALMDWVKKWLTEQEKVKMEAITPEPEKVEAP